MAKSRKLWPWVVVAVVVAASVYQLRAQGRLWFCACGYLLPWSSDAWSADNSQHLFDPYSFTHVLHGFIFWWLLAWILPRASVAWRFCLTISLEALWEVVENTDFVIRHYRETTQALGYQGDTVVNVLGDILTCGFGFLLAWRLGFRRTLALFILTEVVLLVWIRDSLLLNILMLVYPLEGIKAWQAGHG
ncbi:MAG TPA: DUF2585 family protein [Pyrinomonadaceae bacterium]|nr:DUF2585 family protein [Pyrinomonadaceae bacterium]